MRIMEISSFKSDSKVFPSFQKKASAKQVQATVKNIMVPSAIALAMFAGGVAINSTEKSDDKNVVQKTVKTEPNKPFYLQPEFVRHTEDFELNGEKYTMIFADYASKYGMRDENSVSEIFFVPESYVQHKIGIEELNSPPKLESLKYHELPVGQDNFVSVVVSESSCEPNGENFKRITREIVLPPKTAESLMKLFRGETKYYMLPGFNTYKIVNTDEIEPRQEEIGKTVINL